MKKISILFGLFLCGSFVSAETAITLYSPSGSHIQIRPSAIMGQNYTLILPQTPGVDGQVLEITAVQGSTITTTWASGGGGGGSILPAFVLSDSNGSNWVALVNSSGHMSTSIATSPDGSMVPHSLTVRDNGGHNWSVSITTHGNLVTTSVSDYTPSFSGLAMKDSNSVTWAVTISTGGVFNTN